MPIVNNKSKKHFPFGGGGSKEFYFQKMRFIESLSHLCQYTAPVVPKREIPFQYSICILPYLPKNVVYHLAVDIQLLILLFSGCTSDIVNCKLSMIKPRTKNILTETIKNLCKRLKVLQKFKYILLRCAF